MGNRQDYEKNQPRAQGQENIRDSKHAPAKHQKGPQAHAEGQQGPKAHARFIEQLHEGRHEEPAEERVEEKREAAAYEGKRRLVEDRQQHDEAEKNSEHTRLFVERERGRDDGPSDNEGDLHGVLGHRGHRADYKRRDADGLVADED